jgi:pimeloyl-ACP methyl ester carboxylesterase
MTCSHPDRIGHFVRMEAPLLVVDLANAPQLELFKDQTVARNIMLNPDGLVATAYGRLTVQPLSEAVLARIADEFRYPGIADMVPKYFRDLELDPAGPQRAARAACFSAMTFPVLLLQADSDPNQPLYYFDGGTDLFPDAELSWVTSSGHFSELEQPDQVSAAVREFLRR